jgi:hypothetical protein
MLYYTLINWIEEKKDGFLNTKENNNPNRLLTSWAKIKKFLH